MIIRYRKTSIFHIYKYVISFSSKELFFLKADTFDLFEKFCHNPKLCFCFLKDKNEGIQKMAELFFDALKDSKEHLLIEDITLGAEATNETTIWEDQGRGMVAIANKLKLQDLHKEVKKYGT